MTLVALGLGSNREPRRYLQAGLQALEARYGALQLSDVVESEPVGFRGPNFLNLVVTLQTSETLVEMLPFLKQVEEANGRLPDAPRFSDRTLDIDILIFGDLCGEFDCGRYGEVTLPRPEVTDNAYVLRPLAQLLGTQLHPPSGLTYAQLWESYDQSRQKLWPAAVSLR